MKYVELKKHLEERGILPIYLFEGEEGYFLDGGTKMLLSRFSLDKTLDYASFDGATLKGEKIKSLVSAAEAFPFLSEKRVVRVTEFYPTEKEYESFLKKYFENPSPSSLLIIVNSQKGKKDAAKLSGKANVTSVDCSRADEDTVKKWIYLTAKRAGVYADGIVCDRIASYCTGDMSRISKETEKLLSYCTGRGETKITDELVDAIVYPDAEYKIFELSSALSRKNYSAFSKIVADLLSKGNDELSLLSSLAYHFKSLYETSVSRGSDKEIALALGMKEYAVKKSREQATRLGRERALSSYLLLYDFVSGVKNGTYTPQSALKTATASLFFD